MTRVLLLLILTTASALAERNEAWPADAPYNKLFDPWHACMAAEDLAKRGAPDALHTLFLATYVRLNQPFLSGEGDETMNLIFQRVLVANGDGRFARALSGPTPRDSERGESLHLHSSRTRQVPPDDQASSQCDDDRLADGSGLPQ